jgi:uncharacterized protein YciI
MPKAQANFPAHRARPGRVSPTRGSADGWALGNPTEGAMGVFTNRAPAEEFIRDDPFVTNGVVSKWTLREWNEVLA